MDVESTTHYNLNTKIKRISRKGYIIAQVYDPRKELRRLMVHLDVPLRFHSFS